MIDSKQLEGPDLTLGIAGSELADGEKLRGHVGEDAVLLVRSGDDYFAVGPECTHYHGPLADGVVADGEIRCPWHHACFDLRTGEAVRAPAFSPLACWVVDHREDKVFVRDKKVAWEPKIRRKPADATPSKIVIVGGGAAGFAAAEMLRREQFGRSIVMLSNDDAPPVDRAATGPRR